MSLEVEKSKITLGTIPAEKSTVPFAPVVGAPKALTPADAKETKRERTIDMMFPRRVHLTISHGRVVAFEPGVNPVPSHLANHPYLKAHGAYVYKAPVVSQELIDKANGDKEKAADQQTRDTAFAQLVKDNLPKTETVPVNEVPSPAPVAKASGGSKKNASGKRK